MKEASAVAQKDRGLHVVAAEAVIERQRVHRKQRHRRDEAAGHTGQTLADQVHVDKRHRAEERRQTPQARFIAR